MPDEKDEITTTTATPPPPSSTVVGDIVDPSQPNIRQYQGITYDVTDPKYQGISKNSLKRMLREEVWNATRERRNAYQKQKKKQKSAERRKLIQEGVLPAPSPKRPKTVEPSKIKVVIDCSFSSYMSEKEIKSLQAQLVRCHSANRSSVHPMEIFITSFDDALKGAFEKKAPSYVNWKGVDFVEESYDSKFEKDRLVYLSADSDNSIEELDENKVYIIGGIVDKNRYKGLCQNKATEQGIATARLPIGEYIEMASRKVLTVNHVYEIMIKWLESKDWESAFKEVIPGRKLKDSKWKSEDGSEDEEADAQEDQGEGASDKTEKDVAA
ncbi:guanine-1-methyltransferase-domain-containing protein [Dichotomocladium elegans]|nr:guanine-1-methyltransferase-domain-containing protein [Dichotomocladium elegans]